MACDVTAKVHEWLFVYSKQYGEGIIFEEIFVDLDAVRLCRALTAAFWAAI